MSKVWSVGLVAAMLVLLGLSTAAVDGDSEKVAPDVDSVAAVNSEVVIAYYLHGTQRCATCMKLEAYSEEAIKIGFADRLADSSLVWRVVNFDDDANKHFVKDYGLFSQAVVLSRTIDGAEVAFKNLDKIWEKVGDKDDFIAYVRKETKSFLENETATD